MDRNQVQEYIAKEKGKAEEVVANSKGRIRSLKELFPEYDFDENSTISTSLEPYAPIWELAPFREKVIVHVIVRLKSEEEFRKWYGVSVEELRQLVKQDRALLMMTLPQTYSDDIPEYLDPILESNPPSSIRFGVTAKSLPQKQLDICDDLAKRFSSLSKVSVDGSRDETGERAYHTTRTLATQLLTLGHWEDIERVSKILDEAKINDARRVLEFLRLYHVGPSFYSLGGLHTIAWHAMQPSSGFPRGVVDQVEFFDRKLAHSLVRKLKLYRPHSVVESSDVFKDYAKARRALREAQVWFRKKGITNAETAPLEEIERKFDEVLSSYDKRRRICEVVFWGGGLILGVLPGGIIPALIMGGGAGGSQLIARVTSKPDPIMSSLAAITTAPGLRTFFDVRERAYLSRKD